MSAPFKKEFNENGRHITTVVMDEPDFVTLCDGLVGIFDRRNEARTGPDQIALLKREKHIPLIMKGELTKHIFENFDIATDYASFIVRGHGMHILNSLIQ
jgi:hypothetical protein